MKHPFAVFHQSHSLKLRDLAIQTWGSKITNKPILLILGLLLFGTAHSQERFFKYTYGWHANSVVEKNNQYVVLGIGTEENYQHFLTTEHIDEFGDSISSNYIYIDTAGTEYRLKNSFSETQYAVAYLQNNSNQHFWSYLIKYNDDFSDTINTKIIDILGYYPMLYLCTEKNDTSLILAAFNGVGSTLYSSFLEVDTSGQVRWQKDFYCGSNCEMRPFHILPTPDKGYLFTCFETHMSTMPGPEDIFTAVIKTDSLGNTQWRHTWGGDSTKNIGSWVVPLDDGNYLYAWTDNDYSGYNAQLNPNRTIHFIKFDIAGNIIWHKDLHNFIHERSSEISQMELMPDGNIIIAHSYFREGGLIKIDQDANLIWYRDHLMPPGLSLNENTASHSYMKISGVTFTSDGGFALAGEYFSSGDGNIYSDLFQSAYIYKLDEYGCYVPNCHVGVTETAHQEQGFTIQPNPATDYVVVKSKSLQQNTTIDIYDLTGKLVKQTSLRGTKQSIQVEDLEQGIYLVKVGTETQKLIIE